MHLLLAAAIFATVSGTAHAQSPSSAPGPATWEPIEIEHVPPRQSWELGITMGYAAMPFFVGEVPSWGSLGIKGGYGAHVGDNRFAGALGLVIDGPAPVHMTAAAELLASWDLVHKNLQVGASVGPALLWHSKLQTYGPVGSTAFTPVVAARIGYSAPYSAIARRVFAVLEPKLKIVAGVPAPSVAVFIGAGMGR